MPLLFMSANMQPSPVVFTKLLPNTNTGNSPDVYPNSGVMVSTDTSGV